MTKTPGQFEPSKPITKAEREARKVFRQLDAEKAMTEHEIDGALFELENDFRRLLGDEGEVAAPP